MATANYFKFAITGWRVYTDTLDFIFISKTVAYFTMKFIPAYVRSIWFWNLGRRSIRSRYPFTAARCLNLGQGVSVRRSSLHIQRDIS